MQQYVYAVSNGSIVIYYAANIKGVGDKQESLVLAFVTDPISVRASDCRESV